MLISSFVKHCHVWGVCVTDNNGVWIGWLDLLALLLKVQSFMTVHNPWLPKTHSIPYWTDLRIGHFFSARCPLVNTPQLNTQFLTNSLTTESLSSLTNSEWFNSPELNYLTSMRTEYRAPPRTVRVLHCLSAATKRVSISRQRSVVTDTCLATCYPATGSSSDVDCVN
jgi:hypothetical protein